MSISGYAIGYGTPVGVIAARMPLLNEPKEALAKLQADYSEFERAAALVCFYDYREYPSWEEWQRSEFIQLDAPLGFFYLPWHGEWGYEDAYRP